MGIFDFFRGRVEKAIEEKEGRPYIPFTVEKKKRAAMKNSTKS